VFGKPTYRMPGKCDGKARCRDGSAISPSVVFSHPLGSFLGIGQVRLLGDIAKWVFLDTAKDDICSEVYSAVLH